MELLIAEVLAEEDAIELEADAEEPDPSISTVDGIAEIPDYSDRGDNDYVVSGPLGDARGRGHRFKTVSEAAAWGRARFGSRFRRQINAGPFRWALLVRRLYGQEN